MEANEEIDKTVKLNEGKLSLNNAMKLDKEQKMDEALVEYEKGITILMEVVYY